MTVFEEVRGVVAEILGIDKETIKREVSLTKDLQANSLDLVEIITLLEEKYDLAIVDDDIAEIDTVGDIADFIEERVKV